MFIGIENTITKIAHAVYLHVARITLPSTVAKKCKL